MQKNLRQCRRFKLAATSALAIAMLSGGISVAHAQQTPPPAASAGEQLVTLDVRNAKLEQAILALSNGPNGVGNIVFENPNNREFGSVTVRLTDKPLRLVLEAIAKSAGALLEEKEGIFYLRHPADQEAKPGPKPQTPAPAPAPPPEKKKPGQMVKIHLTYLLPDDFKKMLDDPNYQPDISESGVKDWIPPTTPRQLPAPSFSTIPGPGMNPAVVPGTPVPSGATGSGAGRDGESAGARAQVGGRGGGGFGGGQGGLGGGGFGGQGGGFGGQGGGGFGGQGGQGTLRPPGINNIISSNNDNSIIVDYEDVEDLNRLREIIRYLDVAPKQVVIKAEFVSVAVADLDNFGIDWSITPSNNLSAVTSAQQGGGTPSIVVAYASGNAVGNLRMALTRNTTNILQSPIISTVNNVAANIQVSDILTVPQTIVSQTVNGTVTGTQFIQIPAINGLFVLPHINGDGTITMTLTPILQTVDQQAGGTIRTQNQSILTTRRIRTGETMVLGGFVTKQESRQLQKVPFLSDLPIIGNLFTQRNRNVTGTEILVFLTPTIIEDQSQGTTGVTGSPAPTP